MKIKCTVYLLGMCVGMSTYATEYYHYIMFIFCQFSSESIRLSTTSLCSASNGS